MICNTCWPKTLKLSQTYNPRCIAILDCLPWRPLLLHSRSLKTLCSEAQVQVNAAICHWCLLSAVGDWSLHIFQWVFRERFSKCSLLSPFYKQLQREHMGQSCQDTISQIVAPVADTRDTVFCLMWDSSFCASMDGSCSENQDTQNAPTYSGCWPPPGGKPHLNC